MRQELKRIGFAEILANQNLIAEYAAECSIPEIGDINPQADMYADLESKGVIQMFGAYCDGALVGFASVLMTIYPHYGVKIATMESQFVSPAFRRSGYGTSLMRAVRSFAKENGCKKLIHSAPVGGKLERVLSKKKGARKTSSIFVETLL